MSSDHHATSSFDRFVLWAIRTGRRLARAWRALSAKRRLAAYAAFGLFIGLFLPWYSQTVVATGARASAQSVSVSGWGAFSLVQTVVLLVSVGVLVLLFERADGGKVRLPGGDGRTIMAAGCATFVLTVWGVFDRPSASGPGQYTTATGIEWGIFLVLVFAALLAYAGSQIRLERELEPRARDTRGPRTDDATRVSKRTAARRAAAYDQPTPVSARRAAVDAPTRVSKRRTGEGPTQRIGPAVVPEDPPTMRIPPRKGKGPQDGLSTNEK
jgi:hypothetical protein